MRKYRLDELFIYARRIVAISLTFPAQVFNAIPFRQTFENCIIYPTNRFHAVPFISKREIKLNSTTPKFYDYQALSKVLSCTERHIANLVASGRIPRPIKLGRLVRWPAADIEQWTAAGCPDAATWEAMKPTTCK